VWEGCAVRDAGLLEREAELSAIKQAIDAALRGAGGVLLVEGGAGIGKSALLAEARATADGMSVLAATGGELERDFPYGVVRQLFEPVLQRLSPGERDEVLAGAAAPAAGIVAGAATAAEALSIQHALYWLTVNLAARAPLLLTVAWTVARPALTTTARDRAPARCCSRPARPRQCSSAAAPRGH
jgi:hypothetical protein